MSEHSPGPWITGASPNGETFDSLTVLDTIGDCVCNFGDYPDLQQRANAALIAKPPQMHALVRQAVDQFLAGIEEGSPIGVGDVAWVLEFVKDADHVING